MAHPCLRDSSPSHALNRDKQDLPAMVKVRDVVQPVADAAKVAARKAKEAAVDGAHWIQEQTADALQEQDIWVPVNHLDRFVAGQGRDWAEQGYEAFVVHFQAEHVQWLPMEDGIIVEASKGARRTVVEELAGVATPQGHEWRYDGSDRFTRAGRMVAKLAQEAFYAPRGEVKVTAYPPE